MYCFPHELLFYLVNDWTCWSTEKKYTSFILWHSHNYIHIMTFHICILLYTVICKLLLECYQCGFHSYRNKTDVMLNWSNFTFGRHLLLLVGLVLLLFLAILVLGWYTTWHVYQISNNKKWWGNTKKDTQNLSFSNLYMFLLSTLHPRNAENVPVIRSYVYVYRIQQSNSGDKILIGIFVTHTNWIN